MIRKHIIFKGQVQNVGFRIFVMNIAINNNLSGYIKNLNDITLVECELQGSESQVNNALKIILKGNLFIKINDYTEKLVPIQTNNNKFNIIY